ncbi:MAG: hypothetical protein JNM94_02000 [Phycisphaerae bacterium]|nr:hypothetical protein [Phycisphaerae bacterium]
MTLASALRLLVVAAVLAVAAFARADAVQLGDLTRAQEAYDQGIDLKAKGKTDAARQAFRDAADRYRTLIAGGAHNADLYYNLGNALVQSGDLGHGIANYVRALRLKPHDASLVANLNTARGDVAMRLPGTFDTDVGAGIAWWRVVSEPVRLWTSIALWSVFWALVLWAIVGRTKGRVPSWARMLRGAALVAALVVGGTVIADRWYASSRVLGVVVADDVVLRKGNGDGFEPQVEEKLTPGVEFRLVESRGAWLRVRLADGTEGWVRADQAEVV